ncbi:MAG: hypothetical protein HY607_10725 [Planctomycetes bacterium]|nr:hypothetical protein [Planctomycetota bacterium]
MRNPLAQSAIAETKPALSPVGVNAIVTHFLRLFSLFHGGSEIVEVRRKIFTVPSNKIMIAQMAFIMFFPWVFIIEAREQMNALLRIVITIWTEREWITR